VTAYLADAVDWTTFNEVYQETFQPPYPTRTTVGAELRGIRVEISAVAFVQG
jgi:2-iminobutanoate/2-iminopropanoate deaminase